MAKRSKVPVSYSNYSSDGSWRSRRAHSSHISQQKKLDELLQRNVRASPPSRANVAPVPLHLRCIQATPPGFDCGRVKSPPRMYSSYRNQQKKFAELQRNSHGFPTIKHREPMQKGFGCIPQALPLVCRRRSSPVGMTIVVPVLSKQAHDCDIWRNICIRGSYASEDEENNSNALNRPYTTTTGNPLFNSKHKPTYNHRGNGITNQKIQERKNIELTLQENEEENKRVTDMFNFILNRPRKNANYNNVKENTDEGKGKEVENHTREIAGEEVQGMECYPSSREGNIMGTRNCRSSNQNFLEGKCEDLILREPNCKAANKSGHGARNNISIHEEINEHIAGMIPKSKGPSHKCTNAEVQNVEDDNLIDKGKVQHRAVSRFELGISSSDSSNENVDVLKSKLSVDGCTHKGTIFILPWY